MDIMHILCADSPQLRYPPTPTEETGEDHTARSETPGGRSASHAEGVSHLDRSFENL